ncbi:Cytochrome b5 isoform A [Ranunculus cassubicifolius]
MPTLTKLYSMKEAAEHNKKDDCWIVVDGKVYDVSDYLDEHPGGDDVLLTATGRDATEDFEDAGHSKDAIKLMEEFCIGELDPEPTPIIEDTSSKEETRDLTRKFLDITSQYWGIPVGIVSISVVVVGLFYLRKK